MELDEPGTTDEKSHYDFNLAHVEDGQNHALAQNHASTTKKNTTAVIDTSKTLAETPTATRVTDDTAPQEQATIYPTGWRFILVTLGIMASVLVVALDNYIISRYPPNPPNTPPATAIPRLATDFHSINLTG
ncbi:mfs transporter protein [Rutstroemia sp. NJR-2017a WRK4]|nr:mfs transporter protein [Rutstroemia sp. NJR-2017a WRK4]